MTDGLDDRAAPTNTNPKNLELALSILIVHLISKKTRFWTMSRS